MESTEAIKDKQVKDHKPLPLSMRYFLEGIVAGAVILALLVGWMTFRSDEIVQKLQETVPAKTVTIQTDEAEKVDLAKENQEDKLTEETEGLEKNIALPPAPMEGLIENAEGKTLPISRLQDDMTPFQAYKRPSNAIAGRARVSLVIVDYGLSDTISRSILEKLSPDVTLALNPYATTPAKWAEESRRSGHEFWLSLPMQTEGFEKDDTGPDTLLTTSSITENEKNLFNVMGSVVGYVGLISQKNHIFQNDDPGTTSIMKQIFGRGLAFAESNPSMTGYGSLMAKEFGYPYIQNNLWLDDSLDSKTIDDALNNLELLATKNGKMVAFMHPYPKMIDKINEWIKTADQKSIQIVPLSALVE